MKKAIACLVMTFLFMSCWNSHNNKKEGFYDYSQTWDLYRVPLIEPYQIISADKGHSWSLNLKGNEIKGVSSINNIQSIGLYDTIFTVFSPRIDIPGDRTNVWFIINAAKKEGKYFVTEKDFKNYLKEHGLAEIKLYEINQVFTDFDKEKRLPPEWPRK